MEGVHRFLARAWRLFEGGLSGEAPSAEQLRQLHSTIKRVSPLAVLLVVQWRPAELVAAPYPLTGYCCCSSVLALALVASV